MYILCPVSANEFTAFMQPDGNVSFPGIDRVLYDRSRISQLRPFLDSCTIDAATCQASILCTVNFCRAMAMHKSGLCRRAVLSL